MSVKKAVTWDECNLETVIPLRPQPSVMTAVVPKCDGNSMTLSTIDPSNDAGIENCVVDDPDDDASISLDDLLAYDTGASGHDIRDSPLHWGFHELSSSLQECCHTAAGGSTEVGYQRGCSVDWETSESESNVEVAEPDLMYISWGKDGMVASTARGGGSSSSLLSH